MYLHVIRGKWIAIKEDKAERSDTVHESGENVTSDMSWSVIFCSLFNDKWHKSDYAPQLCESSVFPQCGYFHRLDLMLCYSRNVCPMWVKFSSNDTKELVW